MLLSPRVWSIEDWYEQCDAIKNDSKRSDDSSPFPQEVSHFGGESGLATSPAFQRELSAKPDIPRVQALPQCERDEGLCGNDDLGLLAY